jgi:hypothetical protein
MPGPHYALSEAVLVVAALWAAIRLFRGGFALASVGVLLFGVAAAMGVWRFGSSIHDTGAIEEWATVHRTLSLTGGVIGLALIVAQMCRVQFPVLASQQALAGLAVGSMTLGAITLFQPVTATPLFLALLITGVALVLMLQGSSSTNRSLATAWFALFLLNVLLVRRSELLGPSLSWHFYHLLIALWVVGVAWILLRGTDSRMRA